jgi:hypothetical protein
MVGESKVTPLALTLAFAFACSSSGSAGASPDDPSLPGRGGPGTADDAGVAEAGASAEGGVGAWSFRTAIITSEHRAIPGVMFGGWGPHLGHLVRVTSGLYWVDDACAPGSCDVNRDSRLDYWRIDGTTMTHAASVTLPAGIQQNTGTIASADTISTFGVDVAKGALVECTYAPDKSAPPACTPLALDIGPTANYVGAAIHPTGSRLTWLTNVVDGGGGSFRWYADYGGGWNGPRTGGIGGYNDASYINAGFVDRANPGKFVLFAELVTGKAPNWTFTGGTGEGDLSTTGAVTWAVAPSVAADPTSSTADLFVDPDTKDIHVLARSRSNALVYLHRPAGGAWTAGSVVDPSTIAGRFCFTAGRLFIAHGTGASGFVIQEVDRAAGLDFATHPPAVVPLPAGFENVVGAYPEASTYQTTAVGGVNLALVANGKENVALGVFATPPAP